MQSERVAIIAGSMLGAAIAAERKLDRAEEEHQAQEKPDAVEVYQAINSPVSHDPAEEGLTRQQRRYRERQLAKARKAIDNA
jgi:hypothetical protein